MHRNVHQDLYDQLRNNKKKTKWIIVLFFLIICLFSCLIGWLFDYIADGTSNVNIIFNNSLKVFKITAIVLFIYMAIMIHFSTGIIMHMNDGTRVTSRKDAPVLWDVVHELSVASGLPCPRIYIVDDPSPNAFSVGTMHRKNSQWKGISAIGATEGILKIMNREELEGVIGHEMSHILDEDTRVESIGIALTSIFAFVGNVCLELAWFSALFGNDNNDDYDDSDSDSSGSGAITLILLCIGLIGKLCAGLSYLTQLMLSRNREYLADAGSVDLTRNPQGLINAFRALVGRDNMRSANPSSNSLYIVNPDPEVSRSRWSMANILDTHPSLSNRIKRLQDM